MQVRIAEGDEAKTTCVTRYGSFSFLVMAFGLTNAPATFCNLMNDVFSEYIDRFVVVYLDDIVIYSESLRDHITHLRLVFEKLREHKLYVKREKCEFARKEVIFLGHKTSSGRVRMDESQVQAIVDWPSPVRVSELRSFLGLSNSYRRFVSGQTGGSFDRFVEERSTVGVVHGVPRSLRRVSDEDGIRTSSQAAQL